ncbi:MAG: prepilin-type N-terminal cleavage/methylation domain-containing protein [Desulfosarcinaceae bacterium]|nr:prepilin-type N-terminal cleavage/methylation domain-containing protein [Desulfosarcinaceae bacterium]
MNQSVGFKGVRGFTLLEVMVAVTIVAIALSAVYKLYSQAFAMNQSARFYTTAALLAETKLAELNAQAPRDLTSDTGDFEDAYADYRWEITVTEVAAEALTLSLQSMRQIDIVITHAQQGDTFSLRTYRFDNNV